MIRFATATLLLLAPAAAFAQAGEAQPIAAGTLLEVRAEGKTTRVPASVVPTKRLKTGEKRNVAVRSSRFPVTVLSS